MAMSLFFSQKVDNQKNNLEKVTTDGKPLTNLYSVKVQSSVFEALKSRTCSSESQFGTKTHRLTDQVNS